MKFAEVYEVLVSGVTRTIKVADPSNRIPLPETEPSHNAMGKPAHICQVEGCTRIFWGTTVSTFCYPCWKLIQMGRTQTGYNPPRGSYTGSNTALVAKDKEIAELKAQLAAAQKPATPKKAAAPRKKAAAPVAPAAPAETTPEVA
jgi:hypothetical protein